MVSPARPRFARLLERAARGEDVTQGERGDMAGDAAADALCRLLRSAGWAPVGTLDERIELLRRCARFRPACRLEVDGLPVEARVSIEELWRVYLALCSALANRCSDSAAGRTLVGIAGPPGSGKSVFAALLGAILNCIADRPSDLAVVVPLDGFHYPNAYLDSHHATGAGGAQRSLRSRKGAPDTFDVQAFARALELLASEPRVALPSYDRRTHDPVEDGIIVEPGHRVALVEGNYLLLERDGWAEAARRLDMRLFLSMELTALRARLIERHVRGGRSPEDAERHFDRVDRANYDICMCSASAADLIVERTADQRIGAVTSAPGSGDA